MSVTYRLVADEPDFLVIDKLSAVSFHAEEDEPGLFAQIEQDYPHYTLYPVHRLDRVTSGLLLLAKHKNAARELGVLFESRQVQKWYLALADQAPSKKQGMVKGDMQRTRDGCWKLARSVKNPAITRFISCSVAPKLRLYLLQPHTGKTHQLRVMMKSLGSPVIGDARYGGSAADRAYLHAFALQFAYAGQHFSYLCVPDTGVCFLTSEVQTAIAAWLKPWDVFPWGL